MEAPESEDVGNGRIAQMWEILDTRREGEIDFKGLKKGFTKMDHRECSFCIVWFRTRLRGCGS